MLLSRIDHILSRAIGLDPASLGPSGVSSAVGHRMRALGMNDPVEYAARLDDSAELDALVEEVVVRETWFFRERAVFASVVTHARETLRASPQRVYRVLSMPCSTGEELYTISMALQDAGIPAERVSLDGIDISRRALQTAQRGVYGAGSFRGDDLDYRARHFARTADGYEVRAHVRQPVRLRHGNLIEPLLFADQGEYSAIFCRNVLIYLTTEARASVLASIDRLLGPGGIVIAGHAEALDSMTPHLRRSAGSSFVFTRSDSSRPAPGERRRARATACATPFVRERPAHVPAVHVRVPEPPAPATGLAHAATLADSGQLDQARALVLGYLEHARPCAAAFYLMGVIDRARKDLASAERCFNKALYLDPSHEEALLHLALIWEGRGEAERAQTLRRRAERAGRDRGAA